MKREVSLTRLHKVCYNESMKVTKGYEREREWKYSKLIGQVFNSWTVLKYFRHTETTGLEVDYFLCRCKCGTESKIRKYNLFGNGRITKSCVTCSQDKPKDRTGERYGKITLTSYNRRARKMEHLWNGVCDCGYQGVWNTKKLGKLKDDVSGKCRHKSVAETAPQVIIFNRYQKSAIDRKLSFDLTQEELSLLIGENCHYCGSECVSRLTSSEEDFYYNGIDRKNSKKGYTLSNSVTCCKFCNYAKGTKSYSDFKKWIQRVVKFRGTNDK